MNLPIRLGSFLAAALFCWGIQTWAMGSLPFNLQRLIALAGLYVVLAVSLNLINGITGQFSIGHAAFYQVGAYLAGYFSIHNFNPQGMPPWLWLILMMILGALGASLAGLVVGLPSLRLRGDYLAIVTLGFGEIIRIFVQNTKELGGSYALDKIPKIQSLWLIWGLAIVCIAVCRNLLKTAHGLSFLAVREDEVASSAMGVNVTKVKVMAFVLGSGFAGAAGALLAHWETSITPQTFSMDVSFIILTMVVLGGTGSITGSVLAALVLFYLPEYLRNVSAISGSTLVAVTLSVITAVAVMKRLVDHYHRPMKQRVIAYLATIVGSAILGVVLNIAFRGVESLAKASFTGDKLRLVIFATTLIILMLLRPQGIFAHHEFSWDWVRRLFRRPAPTPGATS
ncbi:MAG TPA: branched-chain amino acid ABC transporter permease [Fimbriimonadaceae bacterium]|nr:branched-chain amino acid ABC transporter permease [Fimbriimonadaceae bacterium]HRJ32210.1 branched-chain amino acid ABC transporter permease [Fimbriimonadaceae bacterium]